MQLTQIVCEYCQSRPCYLFSRFCSKRCASHAVNAGLCIYCHKRESTAGHKFCSKICAAQAQIVGTNMHKTNNSKFAQKYSRKISSEHRLSKTTLPLTISRLAQSGNINSRKQKQVYRETSQLDEPKEQEFTSSRQSICALPGCTRSVMDLDGTYCSPLHEGQATQDSSDHGEKEEGGTRGSRSGLWDLHTGQRKQTQETASDAGVTYISYGQQGSVM